MDWGIKIECDTHYTRSQVQGYLSKTKGIWSYYVGAVFQPRIVLSPVVQIAAGKPLPLLNRNLRSLNWRLCAMAGLCWQELAVRPDMNPTRLNLWTLNAWTVRTPLCGWMPFGMRLYRDLLMDGGGVDLIFFQFAVEGVATDTQAAGGFFFVPAALY